MGDWPSIACSGINDLEKTHGMGEVLKRLGGHADQADLDMIRKEAKATDVGNPFFNETYVRWLYRVASLEYALCHQDNRYIAKSTVSNRSYNLLEHSGTAMFAYDIDLVREAIGA